MTYLEDKRTKQYQLPDSDRMVGYATYRKITGQCETCKQPMGGHPECDGCGVLCGEGHLNDLPSSYRGHTLCSYCVNAWENFDTLEGGEATWDVFKYPKPKKLVHRKYS